MLQPRAAVQRRPGAVVIPMCGAFSARRAGAGSIVDAGRRASLQRPAGRDPSAGALADKDAHILVVLIRGMDDNGVAVGWRRCLDDCSCSASPQLFRSCASAPPFSLVDAPKPAAKSLAPAGSACVPIDDTPATGVTRSYRIVMVYDVCHCQLHVNGLGYYGTPARTSAVNLVRGGNDDVYHLCRGASLCAQTAVRHD